MSISFAFSRGSPLPARLTRSLRIIAATSAVITTLGTSGTAQPASSDDDLAARLRASSAEYRRGLRDAESRIRGAGYTCVEALKAWHPELAPTGVVAVICKSGLPSGELYLFQLRDDGGKIVVTAMPS